MRATNLQYRCPKEETPSPYFFTVKIINIFTNIKTMNNGKTVEYGKEPYAPGSFTRAVRFNREKVRVSSIQGLYLARTDGNDWLN
jgi:hypothetical protein